MKIQQIDCENRAQTRKFLDFPFDLYASHPVWTPPIRRDAARMLDSSRHPFYSHGRAAFFLAIEEQSVIGRLAVLINDLYNAHNQENTAFFYLFECRDHLEAAMGLFDAATAWARSQGMTRLIGPKGFVVFDGIGLLVRGYEHPPAFGLPYNFPYYARLIEAAGLQPDRELVSGYLDERLEFPAKIHRAAELLMRRRGLHIARFESRKDLKALIPHLKELYNGSLIGTSGNAPLTDEDVAGMSDQMLWFADPKLIKIVMKGSEPVGFLFAYPDVSAALKKTKGRLFPFGWLNLLYELKTTQWVNINGAGMKEGYRGLGGTALLFSEMYKTIAESRYRYADLVQIGTENDVMLREMRSFGVEYYKAHRLYGRDI